MSFCQKFWEFLTKCFKKKKKARNIDLSINIQNNNLQRNEINNNNMNINRPNIIKKTEPKKRINSADNNINRNNIPRNNNNIINNHNNNRINNINNIRNNRAPSNLRVQQLLEMFKEFEINQFKEQENSIKIITRYGMKEIKVGKIFYFY